MQAEDTKQCKGCGEASDFALTEQVWFVLEPFVQRPNAPRLAACVVELVKADVLGDDRERETLRRILTRWLDSGAAYAHGSGFTERDRHGLYRLLRELAGDADRDQEGVSDV